MSMLVITFEMLSYIQEVIREMYHLNINDFILNDFTVMNSINFGGVTLFAVVRFFFQYVNLKSIFSFK